MDQELQAEIDRCMEDVRVFLQRQGDRYEELEKGIPKPYWC